MIPMPNVGYATNKKDRHVLPSGFLKFVINNVADLELLMMQNRKYAAEVGATKRCGVGWREAASAFCWACFLCGALPYKLGALAL